MELFISGIYLVYILVYILLLSRVGLDTYMAGYQIFVRLGRVKKCPARLEN